MRSAMEVLLTFIPVPLSPPSALPPLARAFLKAKNSPNFFLMFLGGSVGAVLVVKEGVGKVGDAEKGSTSVDVQDASVDGAREEEVE